MLDDTVFDAASQCHDLWTKPDPLTTRRPDHQSFGSQCTNDSLYRRTGQDDLASDLPKAQTTLRFCKHAKNGRSPSDNLNTLSIVFIYFFLFRH